MPGSRRGPRLVEAGLCLFAGALPLSIAAANLGWAVAAMGLALCRFDGEPVDWRAWRGGLAAPLAAYLAAALLSSLFAENPFLAFGQFHKDAHKLWLYALLTTAFTTVRPGRPAAALAAGGTAAALIGIGQWAVGLAGPDPVGRAHAFVHPVTYGELMALLFLGSLCFSADGARRRLAYASVVLTGAALVLSNTRGAEAGAAAGVVALGLAVPRLRRRAALGALLILATAVSLDLLWPGRSLIRSVFRQPEPGMTAEQGQLARVALWKAAGRMAADHPWTGVGVSGYRTFLPYYVKTRFDGGDNSVGNAHNLYLHQLAERGVLGLAALAWLLGAYVTSALRRALVAQVPWRLWSLCAAAAFLVMNVTEVALQVEVVWMLAFFIWTAAEAAE